MMAVQQTRDLRGKVVLRMRGGAANPLVLKAAVRVAHAFRGELRGLFMEDEELLALAEMPFAREISLTGRRSRPLSLDVVRKETRAASVAMEREFDRLTRASRVPMHFEVVQGTASKTSEKAMKEAGILAIGEPLALAGAHMAREMIAELSRFAGLVLVGAEARRARGSIVAVVDPGCDVALLVDTAERLADNGADEVVLLLANTGPRETARLEAEARKALDPGTRYRFERIEQATPRAVRDAVRQVASGLAIAQFGGRACGDVPQALRMACALDCPLLLLSGEDLHQ